MKQIFGNVLKPPVNDIDGALLFVIDISSIHFILSKAFLEMEDGTYESQFKNIVNGKVGNVVIVHHNEQDNVSIFDININKSGNNITYDLEPKYLEGDCTITALSNVAPAGQILPIQFRASALAIKTPDIYLFMDPNELYESQITALCDSLKKGQPEGSSISVNPFIKGATSCELYINGVLTDTFLPFDSNHYWFGTGLNYMWVGDTEAAGPRFGLEYNELAYYTDKLTSDTAKIGSIIRLNTYDDYLIFKS